MGGLQLTTPSHGMFLNQTDIDLVRDGMRALEREILKRGAQAAAVDPDSIARAVFKAFLEHRKALPAARPRKVEALALISMLNIQLFEGSETGWTA